MKSLKFILVPVLICLIYVSTFAKSGGYNIKVKVNGLKDTVCFLAYYYGDKQYLKDTVKVNSKGEMVFKGDEPLPGGIYLIVFPDKKKLFEVIIDKTQFFSIETDTIDPSKHLVVKGSEENTFYLNYLEFIQKKHEEITPFTDALSKTKTNKDSIALLKKEISRIDNEVKKFKSDFKKKYPDFLLSKLFYISEDIEIPDPPKSPDGKIDSSFAYRYYKTHYFDHVDFTDDRILRTPLFHPRLSSYLEKMIHPSPDSIIKECDMLVEKARPNKEMFKYVVWYLTNEYLQSKIMGYDAIYVHMVEKYYMTNEAYWVTPSQLQSISERAQKLKPILIGKIAPNVMYLTGMTGKYLSLYDIPAKYTILVFWSPECGHCKTEVPQLYKIYEKFKDKGVIAFAVSTLRDTAKTLTFIRENKIEGWINALDIPDAAGNYYSNFRSDYDIYATPAVFLLDENKKIIAKKLSPDQIENLLERNLNEEK